MWRARRLEASEGSKREERAGSHLSSNSLQRDASVSPDWPERKDQYGSWSSGKMPHLIYAPQATLISIGAGGLEILARRETSFTASVPFGMCRHHTFLNCG